MSISLEHSSWFQELTELILSRYDAETAQAQAQTLPADNLGHASIHRSLAARGAAFGLPQFDPGLSSDSGFPAIKFLSTLKHQLEIVLDVAVALERPYQGEYGSFAILMVTAATAGDLDRVDILAEQWREILAGQRSMEEAALQLPEHYEQIGELLKKRALLKDDPLLSLPINQGISYFDMYLAGRLANDLYNDGKLERHEVEQTLLLTNQDRIHFVEAIIALAWSNGLLEAEERNLIKKQIQMLHLTKKEGRKLINLMITPSTPKEFARAFSSRETSMFVMRQLIMASLIDGSQDAREQKFLLQTSKEMGLNETELNALQQKMKGFFESHREAIDQMKNYRRTKRTSMI